MRDRDNKTEEKIDKKKDVPKKKPVPATLKFEDRPGFKGIVRLAGKDIRGHIKLKRALTYVRGIGPTLSYSIANILNKEFGLGPNKEVGELSDQDIEKIDKVLFNIQDYGMPKFLLNRRSDMLDGTDKHVIMSDLIFTSKQDIEREKKLYTWKGYRFSYGQKVRGQRTRNTGRTGMTVGVLRKAVMATQQSQKEVPAAGGKGGAITPPAGGTAPTGGGTVKAAEKPAGGSGTKSVEKK